jgi:UDP-2,3-diacylglucosamine pyrophosphatase LpxH
MPTLETSTELIILSDLHLSTGSYLPSGLPDPLEQFVADEAFAHFLEHLISSLNREHQPGRLLFLGDFLDFLHARAEPSHNGPGIDIDTSEEIAHRKLEKIFAGHPVFFEALSRLATAGFHIDIVPGNHDIDLMRPAIQAHFIDLLDSTGQMGKNASQVHFFPWLYLIPGLVYAEHGNQHHDLNSFSTLLTPYHHSHPEALEIPLGAYFDTFIHHTYERVSPSDHEYKSPIRYLAGELIRHPANLIKALPDIFDFASKSIEVIAYRASPGCASRRKGYQSGLLKEYSIELGLDGSTVVSLDKLAASPNGRMLARLLTGMLHPGGQVTQSGYLMQAAQSIHKLLQSKGLAVPYYVFGHSHIATKLRLHSEDNSEAYYLNTGTWSEEPFSDKSKARKIFPFIQIVNVPDAHGATTSLLQWNERLRLPEPLA